MACFPFSLINLRLCGTRSLRNLKWCPRFPQCTACSTRLVLLDEQQWPRLTLNRTPAKKRNRGKISFLDLPLELRQQIYAHVLTTDDEISLGVVALEQRIPHHWHPESTIHKCNEHLCSANGDQVSGAQPLPFRQVILSHRFTLNLLATCKQLHDEGARVMYGQNSFAISLDI